MTSKTMLWIPCLLLFSFSAMGQTPSGVEDLKIQKPYEEAIVSDPFLMEGGISVVTIPGEGEVLIAVGVVANKAKSQPNNPKAFLMTRTRGRVEAQKTVSLWLRTEIETKTTLEKEKFTRIVQTEEGKKRQKVVEKLVKTWTLERSNAALKRAKVVGTWYSEDRQFYYTAVRVRAVE